MRRLTLSIFAASFLWTGPALAQDAGPEADMVERLDDPAFQGHMVLMMSGIMAAIMDFPIGQVAGVLDKAIPDEMRRDRGLSDIDPDATLSDSARQDDPDFDRNAEEKMRQGTAMMGIMAAEFGTFLPELREMGERMKGRVGRTR